MDSASLDAQQQLEEYVRGRITAFAALFAAEVAPSLTAEQVGRITERILADNDAAVASTSKAAGAQQSSLGPAASHAPPTLVYKHDCRALGCRDMECMLCQFNPERVCERNFQKKYLVGDLLKAKCGAPIRLELVDSNGNVLTDSKYSNMEFELNIVDGIAFKERGGEVTQLTDRELRGCIKYTKKEKAEPLLCYKSAPSAIQRIMVRLTNGVGTLPELTVTESSEALLAGRRPPFRLIAWMSDSYGLLSGEVRYGVSNEFVVATRRVRQANKVEIPLMDDPVGKVEHIGRETMKKLADLRIAALESGLPEVAATLDERTARIETVGQFQQLLHIADTDTQLRKNLQMILKLPKDKWEETAAHAMSAVVPDFRRRVWYPPGHNVGLGLMFGCKYGAPLLNQSVSLAQNNGDDGVKVIAEDQLDPASLNILRELKATAVKRWAEPHHPGWGIFRESEPPAAAAATAAAGPFSIAHDAAARAAAAAAAPAAAWRGMQSSGSLGGRASSMGVDPAAAAALPVPPGAITPVSRKNSSDASPPAAAAAAAAKGLADLSQDSAGDLKALLPRLGSKRTAGVAGLGAAAAAAGDGSSKAKRQDHTTAAAAAAAGSAASGLYPAAKPNSAAAAAAAAIAAANSDAAAAGGGGLPLAAALPSVHSSSNPLESNLGPNAAAVIQAAAAAMAAAQAAGVSPSEVVAKFTKAISAGMQDGQPKVWGSNPGKSTFEPIGTKGGSNSSPVQRNVLQPPKILAPNDLRQQQQQRNGSSSSGRDLKINGRSGSGAVQAADMSGLTGLDAVAAAAAAAEAAEIVEKLEHQQQQQQGHDHVKHEQRQQQRRQQQRDATNAIADSSDPTGARLSPTAIAAAIVKRLAGSSGSSKPAAAAAAGKTGTNGYSSGPKDRQQQQQQQQQQAGVKGSDPQDLDRRSRVLLHSSSNRSSSTNGGLPIGSSKPLSVTEVAAMAAASMQRLAQQN